jgi:hypothetical protein
MGTEIGAASLCRTNQTCKTARYGTAGRESGYSVATSTAPFSLTYILGAKLIRRCAGRSWGALERLGAYTTRNQTILLHNCSIGRGVDLQVLRYSGTVSRAGRGLGLGPQLHSSTALSWLRESHTSQFMNKADTGLQAYRPVTDSDHFTTLY